MSSNTNSQELIARIKELENENKQLKSRKKFGLVWEDKPEDVVLQCVENVPVLKEVKNRKIVKDNFKYDNLLIEGDNYHALSVLNYTHKGKIDVIYIDPPYNTGNKDFTYNDSYIDLEDTYRHSKWLSFMFRRLKLSKDLLKNNGVIFVSIDDNEVSTLKLMLDEIFGEKNFISQMVWHSSTGGGIRSRFVNQSHQYVLCYSKDVLSTEMFFSPLSDDAKKQYTKSDDVGLYREKDFAWKNSSWGTNQKYFIECPDGEKVKPKEGYLFRFIRETFDDHLNRNMVVFKKTKSGPLVNEKGTQAGWNIYIKKYLGDGTGAPSSVIPREFVGINNEGTTELLDLLGESVFNNPKNVRLITYLLQFLKSKTDLSVLDFFAGSGTTGHAVLELNKQDGGNRKFILCTNNENKICEEVTYERIKRVIKGYTNKKGEKVEGLGGNLSYYKTDLVNIEKLHKVSDEARIKVTYQAGGMIAVREDTLNEVEKNDWWQIFEGNGKATAIYFKENKEKLQELINFLEKKKVSTTLYIFGWGKNEYRNEYSTKNIKIEDIPEPILEVYKEINRL